MVAGKGQPSKWDALLFWGPAGAERILGLGRRAKRQRRASLLPPSLPSFLPSALLTFIFVCLMHADLKEGIGNDSLPN